MRKAVTAAQKHEVLALAAVIGAEAAADQLGWDPRTVRKWQAQAGQRPELDAPTDELQSLYNLAVARVTSDVATGRLKGSALMTVVGITRDKLDRARRWREREPQPDPQTDISKAVDELEVIFAEIYPDDSLTTIFQVLVHHRRLTEGPAHDPYDGYDGAGNLIEAPSQPLDATNGQAVIDEWLATLAALVEEHGSLKAAQEWQRAEDHRRLEAQLERNARNREAYRAAYRESQLDAETRALLDEANRILRETSE